MKDKLTVVKVGSNIIDNADVLHSFLGDFARLPGYKILIHGGGKTASDLSKKWGHSPQMHEGRRITTDIDLDIVTMVYAGSVNKKIVVQLQALGINAIGLTGADADCIRSVKRPVTKIDYGWVGDVIGVNGDIIGRFLRLGLTPVFNAITHDGEGQLLNTNADTVAAEVSIGMSEEWITRLIYCFEKPGVLMDSENDTSIIARINQEEYNRLVDENVIHSGMLPKMHNAFEALRRGVDQVVIGGVDILEKGGGTLLEGRRKSKR